MSQANEERRGTRRFALRLPVALHLPHGETAAHTKDVSARGIYFYCDRGKLDEGNSLDFTLTLPPEITLTSSVQVRCREYPDMPHGFLLFGGRLSRAAEGLAEVADEIAGGLGGQG